MTSGEHSAAATLCQHGFAVIFVAANPMSTVVLLLYLASLDRHQTTASLDLLPASVLGHNLTNFIRQFYASKRN
jgi:hypothetical protein